MRKLICLLFGILLVASVSAISWSGGTTVIINQTTSGGGGGNVTNLTDLLDVTITSPQDDDFLIYNVTSEQWINQIISDVISFFTELDVVNMIMQNRTLTDQTYLYNDSVNGVNRINLNETYLNKTRSSYLIDQRYMNYTVENFTVGNAPLVVFQS